MLRDLDKELSDFASRRQKSSSSSGGSGGTRARAASAAGAAAGVAKSLWDELIEIGEEFVDFLEQASMQPRLLNMCGCDPVRISQLCCWGGQQILPGDSTAGGGCLADPSLIARPAGCPCFPGAGHGGV